MPPNLRGNRFAARCEWARSRLSAHSCCRACCRICVATRLKLYLVEDLTTRLIDLLHQGKLDLVLLALPYDCGAAETIVLFDDPLLAALPAEHPLVEERNIDPQHLSKDLLLLKDGHCLREHALAACDFTGRRYGDEFEATSLQTLVQMVDNGLGTTLCLNSRPMPAC